MNVFKKRVGSDIADLLDDGEWLVPGIVGYLLSYFTFLKDFFPHDLAFLVPLLLLFWKLQRFFFPTATDFYCDKNGLYFGVSKYFVAWQDIKSIHEGKILIEDKLRDAVVVKLKEGAFPKQEWTLDARATGLKTFAFSSRRVKKDLASIQAVTKRSTEESIFEISELSELDRSIQVLLDAGAKLKAISRCRSEYQIKTGEARKRVEGLA